MLRQSLLLPASYWALPQWSCSQDISVEQGSAGTNARSLHQPLGTTMKTGASSSSGCVRKQKAQKDRENFGAKYHFRHLPTGFGKQQGTLILFTNESGVHVFNHHTPLALPLFWSGLRSLCNMGAQV